MIELIQISDKLTFVDSTPWAAYRFANIQLYDHNVTYKKGTVFIINDLAIKANADYVESVLENGHKLIIDSVWESYARHGNVYKEQYSSQVHLMYGGTEKHLNDDQVIPDFFWIHEHLYNKKKKLDQYNPAELSSIKKYDFLMPMRTRKIQRDMALVTLADLLPRALYSYCDKGIDLPMHKTETNMLLETDYNFDRNFNSDWYNDSYFSVVVETFVSMLPSEISDLSDLSVKQRSTEISRCVISGGSVMLTEKIFKPIAFEHPYVLFGQMHSLKRLHDLGFKSFPHIFNEAYDNQESIKERLASIRSCIDDFNTGHYMNPLTKETLEYNRTHFYNSNLIEKMINEEIVKPMQEFING